MFIKSRRSKRQGSSAHVLRRVSCEQQLGPAVCLISLRKFECFWRAFVELFVAVHRPAPLERGSLRCRVVVRLSRTIPFFLVPSCE